MKLLADIIFDSRTSAPGSPVAGQMYFDTTLDLLRYYTGTDWIDIEAGGGGGAGDILKFTASGIDGLTAASGTIFTPSSPFIIQQILTTVTTTGFVSNPGVTLGQNNPDYNDSPVGASPDGSLAAGDYSNESGAGTGTKTPLTSGLPLKWQILAGDEADATTYSFDIVVIGFYV